MYKPTEAAMAPMVSKCIALIPVASRVLSSALRMVDSATSFMGISESPLF
jgi:hypothetical protein